MINNKPVGPNPDWVNKAQEAVKDAAKNISGPAPMPEPVKESLRDVVKHAEKAADNVLEGAKALFRSEHADTIAKKMNIFGSDTNPKELVESIRNAEGTAQAKLLLGFQKELDEMSPKQLDQTMEYIVDQMADDKNLDDSLLGALAKSVMEESSSRGVQTLPGPRWPHLPRPLPVKPELIERTNPRIIKQLDQITFD